MKRTVTLILLVFILVQNNDLWGEKLPSQYLPQVTWGLGTGPLFETGVLKGELATGYTINFLAWWPLPVKNLFVISNLGYDSFFLEHSSSSQMYSLYLEGGLGYRVNVHQYFQPYGGILLNGSYLHVTAQRLDQKEHTFRPGLSLETGIFSELVKGFGLKFGFKSKFASLSRELYCPLSIEIAATFRYGGANNYSDRKGGENQLFIKLQKVRSALASSAVEDAEKGLNDILKKYPDNEEALGLQKRLEAINKTYATGKALYDKGLFIEALPHLEKSSPYFTDAKNKSNAIRARYVKRIKAWEREGVQAYEKQNYDTCITIMRKILLIDPRNRIGGIYLPRAIKRKRALKSLH